jgi:hypothetical protein
MAGAVMGGVSAHEGLCGLWRRYVAGVSRNRHTGRRNTRSNERLWLLGCDRHTIQVLLLVRACSVCFVSLGGGALILIGWMDGDECSG